MPLKMTTQTRPDTTGAAASVAVSAVPTTVVSTATRQPASKDLFGAKTTAAKTEGENETVEPFKCFEIYNNAFFFYITIGN